MFHIEGKQVRSALVESSACLLLPITFPSLSSFLKRQEHDRTLDASLKDLNSTLARSFAKNGVARRRNAIPLSSLASDLLQSRVH